LGTSLVPLTPAAFLARAATVYRDKVAIVDGDRRFTYSEFFERSLRLTGLLASLGVASGDRVAALCQNSHVMLEMHNGVPMRGAVLVPLNVRLSESELSYIVEHSGSRVLIATAEVADLAQRVALATGIELVVAGEGGNYERLLATSQREPLPCRDEGGLLAINYTSGTTGRPKGVMYHHRGAYLQALAMAFHARLSAESVYLWTLPMFHCNGWCFTWAVTTAGAKHVCVRAFDAAAVWRHLDTEAVTHFSAAPTVLTMIAAAPEADPSVLSDRTVHAQTGGAPPSPTLLARMTELNIDVTHLYGLTETFGPIAINDWQSAWDELPTAMRAAMKARQGVGNVISERLRVVDMEGRDVPNDGRTIGEVVVQGNAVMLGYYRDDDANDAADFDGWLRTGDLGVLHSDGYLELRDRAKDVIISGGENIASVEVERMIDSHPGVIESAVVAAPDPTWGEVPVAFVTPSPNVVVSADDIIDYVREHLAHFKAPKWVVFGELPKTSTGKIRKNVLREQALLAGQLADRHDSA
jgi:fatty-acyl-CoA synthase